MRHWPSERPSWSSRKSRTPRRSKRIGYRNDAIFSTLALKTELNLKLSPAAVLQLLSDARTSVEMSARGRQLVDGLGYGSARPT